MEETSSLRDGDQQQTQNLTSEAPGSYAAKAEGAGFLSSAVEPTLHAGAGWSNLLKLTHPGTETSK